MDSNKIDNKSFDQDLSYKILERINSGTGNSSEINVKGIPSFENKSIINMSENDFSHNFDFKTAEKNLKQFTDRVKLSDFGTTAGGRITLTRQELERIGLFLLPLVSVGILNGGAATSYIDRFKNSSFSPDIYDSCRKEFDKLREMYNDSPKGITPAYINSDGSSGASFIELKMRSFLLKIREYRKLTGEKDFSYPIFQMTSMQTDKALAEEYIKYRDSIYLKDLIEETGTDITSVLTEMQPLISAFTHSSEGKIKKIYKNNEGEMLLLPGGHGQNFSVLKNIYRKLYETGKKFVYLGNVDNIGFNIDTAEVALLALTGSEAGFDFALKTPVDVKGGILVIDDKGRLNCGDIGAAVSTKEVEEAEKQGKKILFNCATGLFSLDYLVKNIDFIIDNLPLRVSDQEKEAGRYSQAEQITWEVLSLMDNFLVFGVDKYRRFLASKLLAENLMISRPVCCRSYFERNPGSPLNSVSANLNRGLKNILSHEMQMEEKESRWQPV